MRLYKAWDTRRRKRKAVAARRFQEFVIGGKWRFILYASVFARKMVVIAMKRLSLLSVFVFLTKFVSGLVCVDETLDCRDPVSSIFKIGKDSCACDSDKHAGALKFVDGQLMVCSSKGWRKAQWKTDDAYGTEFNPGKSCKDIKQKLMGSPADGIYWIKIPSADKGFPVYCDMNDGGWTLVYKYFSGVLDPDVLHIHYGELPRAEFVEEAISLTNAYRSHYKNRLGLRTPLNDFDKFHQVKLVLYSSSGTPLFKKPLIFKLPKGTRVTDFFRKENVEQSPWDDLMTTETPATFVTKSVLCRHERRLCRLFEAMKTFKDNEEAHAEKRCDGDSGWLMLTGSNNTVCPFEKKSGRRSVFLYSKGKAAVRFNDDNAVGVADMMAIFVQ